MHTLYTTEAYILEAYPQGESNKVYKLLTRELGLLYAHGQSVRELKSRNRYALQTGEMSDITLVRGRETWRITGAQTGREERVPLAQQIYKKRILHLIGSMVPVEDTTIELFDVLKCGTQAFHTFPEEYATLIEVVTVLRFLNILGYVARPVQDPLIERFFGNTAFTVELIELAQVHKQTLVMRVNNALEGAK
ncbi:TPA: hypothetical protein DEP58_03045 [Patescibacteria group bacterium]|nr:MAG: hypothetical protein UU98_C0018G0042 [Parcubacteria group bacterium GW2011_GWD2_42_14]HCC05258.1 hypothetical protein [Patescibacteria group bacterium]